MLATTLLLLIVLLALSVPVAAVMGVLGLALNEFFASMPLHRAMGEIIWNSSSEYILIAIPLFVMLGEILLRSGIAERVYNAIAQWLSWLPGGLMHANIGIVRHVRGDLGFERRHGGDHRHRRDPRRSSSATTTSGCSSAPSRPAARSASSSRRRSTSSSTAC